MTTIDGKGVVLTGADLSPETEALLGSLKGMFAESLAPYLEAFQVTPEQEQQIAERAHTDLTLYAILADGPYPGDEALRKTMADAARRIFESVVGKVGEG